MKLVVGDVHGDFTSFQALLNAANPGDNDQIFLLGDLIDRGPNSKEVIQWVQNSKQTAVILGNHEDLWLQAIRSLVGEHLSDEEERAAEAWLIPGNGGQATIESFGFKDVSEFFNQPKAQLEAWKTWLESLPLFIEVDNFILTHAGMNRGIPIEHQSRKTLLWDRDWMHEDTKTQPAPGKTLIVGHTRSFSLRHWVDNWQPGDVIGGNGWINLDTGSTMAGFGWLTGLDLDTMTAFQVNQESQQTRSFQLCERLKHLER